ncbi:MAG: dihydroneopterin aldolase [Chloroflexota bacterium]
MDEIFIKDLLVQAVIGVYEWERKQPQNILINIRMFTNTKLAAQTDDLKDCVDYGDITKKVQLFVEHSARFTVEALADDIANLCLGHKNINNVIVRVEKPGVVRGTSSVGIQIERKSLEVI